MLRKEIQLFGSVQGVGLRYRAQYAADHVGVTGWVKNEWDGTVHMEVQGSMEQIDEMFRLIRQGSFMQIEDMKIRELPIEKEERGFHIR